MDTLILLSVVYRSVQQLGEGQTFPVLLWPRPSLELLFTSKYFVLRIKYSINDLISCRCAWGPLRRRLIKCSQNKLTANDGDIALLKFRKGVAAHI